MKQIQETIAVVLIAASMSYTSHSTAETSYIYDSEGGYAGMIYTPRQAAPGYAPAPVVRPPIATIVSPAPVDTRSPYDYNPTYAPYRDQE